MSNVKAQSSNQCQITKSKLQELMNPQKVIIPVKTGVQRLSNYPRRLDSRSAGMRERVLFLDFFQDHQELVLDIWHLNFF